MDFLSPDITPVLCRCYASTEAAESILSVDYQTPADRRVKMGNYLLGVLLLLIEYNRGAREKNMILIISYLHAMSLTNTTPSQIYIINLCF